MAASQHYSATELSAAAVAGWIMVYLCQKPEATDTVRGVSEWWLSRLKPPPSDNALQSVLEELERWGLLLRQINADRTVLWSAGPEFPNLSRRKAIN